jgi:hypothetical protein
MVQVAQSTEELLGTSHLVADDDPSFTGSLDLEELHDGAVSFQNLLHDLLVDLEGVGGRLGQELGVRDIPDIKLLLGIAVGWLLREIGFGNEIATQLLSCSCRDGTRRAIRFYSVCVFWSRIIKENGVDPVLESQKVERAHI